PAFVSFDNVVMTTQDIGGSWQCSWLEVDLELPGWAQMSDPWTARIDISLVNPPTIPVGFPQAYAGPARFIGLAFRAGGYINAVSLGLNRVGWMGGDEDINLVELMSGVEIVTLELSNHSQYENSFISIRGTDGNWYRKSHRIRLDSEISQMFYNNPALDNVNVAIVVISPKTQRTQINFTRFYIGNGAFLSWRDPVVTKTQPFRIYLPSKPFTASLKAEAVDEDGAKLWYRWHLLSAPERSSYYHKITDGYTLQGHYYTDTIYSSSFSGLGPEQDWWVMYENGFYRIKAVGPDSITITSSQFPPEKQNITLQLTEKFMNSAIPSSSCPFPVDAEGIYLFRLEVTNGVKTVYDDTVLMAYSPDVAFGIIPAGDFIWNYLSDIWARVEDRDYLTDYFSVLYQHAASILMNAWQVEADGELTTIRPHRVYRWQVLDMEYEPASSGFVPALGAISLEWTGPISGDCSLKLYNSSQTTTFSFSISANTLSEAVSALNSKFEEQDLPLTAHSYENWLYIRAPYVIEVTGGSIFTVGQTNLMEGDGQLVARNIYRTFQPLFGFQPDGHFLVVRGQALRIGTIKDSNNGPKTELHLLDDLPDISRSACKRWAIPGYSQDSGAYEALIFSGDELTLMVGKEDGTVSTITVPVVGCNRIGFGTLSPWPLISSCQVEPYKIRRTFYYPLDSSVVDIPVLKDKFENGNTWDANYYTITTFRNIRCVYFGHLFPPSYDSTSYEGQSIPMSASFIAEYTLCDNSSVIQANFGKNVGIEVGGYHVHDYLAMVKALWYLFSRGRSPELLKKAAATFYRFGGSPISGTLKGYQLFKNFDYSLLTISSDKDIIYLIDSRRAISVNPATGQKWQQGDTVNVFDYFANSITIKEGRVFPDAVASNRLEAYHRFMVSYPITDGKEPLFGQGLDRWRPKYLELAARPT
ncbi:MAG: hypothetical protein DRP15_03645, partial [Candidatus Aenigmatarchaeota archaeon]